MRQPTTTAEIRANIDRGLTGDKVAWEDPAAAPLGTDDEAAGTRPDPAVLVEERDRGLQSGRNIQRQIHQHEMLDLGGAVPWLLFAAFLLAFVALACLALLYI